MILKIYDFKTLVPLAACSKIKDMRWERYLYSLGKFEFSVPYDDDCVSALKVGNIVKFDGKDGIILYRSLKGYELKIQGCDLKFFCNSRVVVPPFVYKTKPQPIDSYDRIKGNAETVIKHYVDSQCVNPSDSKRKIPNLVCAANQNRGERICWQAKFTKLDEELEKLCKISKFGYDITFDEKNAKFTFDIFAGTDRTVSQTENAPVVFCREYKTISESEYTEDWLSASNLVYVGANGDDEEQYIHAEPSEELEKHFMRLESYTNISSDDVEEVEDGGIAYLEENKPTETVSGTANQRYKYKTDWNLGDMITSKITALGDIVSVDEQIIGVREEYSHCNTLITPIFSTNNILRKMLKG